MKRAPELVHLLRMRLTDIGDHLCSHYADQLLLCWQG
jgi:hypothetical protein